MTFNKFQSEVAFIWNEKTNGEHTSHAEEVKIILRNYGYEILRMEREGKKAQIAFAWKMFKKNLPHLVG